MAHRAILHQDLPNVIQGDKPDGEIDIIHLAISMDSPRAACLRKQFVYKTKNALNAIHTSLWKSTGVGTQLYHVQSLLFFFTPPAVQPRIILFPACRHTFLDRHYYFAKLGNSEFPTHQPSPYFPKSAKFPTWIYPIGKLGGPNVSTDTPSVSGNIKFMEINKT